MKSRYTVTDRAGTYVAGRRAAAGEVLELTDEEAQLDLAVGALVPEGSEPHPMFTRGAAPLAPEAPPQSKPRKSPKAEA